MGSLFEGFIACEIVKSQINSGHRRELYFFRDQQGLEIDFVVPNKGKTWLIEAKATHTPKPEMATPMNRLASAWNQAAGRQGTELDLYLVHRPPRSPTRSTALAPGSKL